MQENRSFDHYFGTLAGRARLRRRGRAPAARRASVFQQPDAGHAAGTSSRSTSTPGRRAPRTSRRLARLAGAARRLERRPDGRVDGRPPRRRRGARALRHGLPHPRGPAGAVRAGRGVHRVRRLARVGARADVAQPHDVDDRHGRPRGPRRRTLPRQRRAARRLPLDHLRRAPHPGGRELAGLPAGRHVRLQRAGAVRGVPPGAPWVGAGGRRPRTPGRSSRSRATRCPTASPPCPGSSARARPRSTRPTRRATGPTSSTSKIDAIAANPDVWAKTAVILTYDENDGLFDHVARRPRRRAPRASS